LDGEEKGYRRTSRSATIDRS